MSRPSTDGFDFKWDANRECPCGSGMAHSDCCISSPFPIRRMESLVPRGPITGYSHERCYLRSSNNCSTKISGEHFISRNVLESLPDFKVSGLPFLRGEAKAIAIDRLTANVLCCRHNSALSPLDSVAGDVFGALNLAVEQAATGRGDNPAFRPILSGPGFELWMMKVLAGLYASRMEFTHEGHNLQKSSFPFDEIAASLTSSTHPSIYKMTISLDQDAHWERIGASCNEPVSIGPIIHSNGVDLSGLHIGMRGIGFSFYADDLRGDDMPTGMVVRPDIMDIEGPCLTSRIYWAWPEGKTRRDIIAIQVEQRTRA